MEVCKPSVFDGEIPLSLRRLVLANIDEADVLEAESVVAMIVSRDDDWPDAVAEIEVLEDSGPGT